MGRLSDLLGQKGLLDGDFSERPGQKKNTDLWENQDEKAPVQALSDAFSKSDITLKVRAALKEASKHPLGKKYIFKSLPSLGEFYIPSSMNGRVIQCSESTFTEAKGNALVVLAKVYAFNGHQVQYLYYDSADGTIQRGQFNEFPCDALGHKMGRVGLINGVLCWKSQFSVVR
ncbi:hypothetical protein WDW89_10285 [Deltaproteobacteria bacterium TL4]